MNFRKFLITPFFIIFIGFSELFRDLFNLPFFGDRLYYLYILIFIFGLFFYSYLVKLYNSYKFLRLTRFEYILYFYIFLFFLLDIYKNKINFFVPLQLLSLTLFLYYYKLITFKLSNPLINKLYLFYTYFVTLCMIAIWLIWFLGKDSLLDIKTRNSLPYIILGIFYYLRSINKKSIIVLLCFFLLVLICQTKGALILFLLVSILDFFNKKYNFNHNLYSFLIVILFFAPFVIIILFNYYFSTNYEDLIDLDKFRYYIRDDLSSFISRILGSGYLLLSNINYLFPIGVLDNIDKDQLLFWGYPIHNYLYLIIIQYGIIGIFFIFFILKLIRTIIIKNFTLGISLLYCLLNFNDFYIGFLIFLLPVFIDNNSKTVDFIAKNY